MDQITAWLDQYRISLLALVMTFVLLGAAAVVIRIFKRLLKGWLLRYGTVFQLANDTIPIVARVVAGLLWLLTALVILELWGVGVGGLWALLVSGAAVVGVGFFATWTMVSNVTASIFIAIWRPFRLGDTVEVLPEGLKGRVIERNLMFVTLREEGGAIIQVPNNQFFQKMIRVAGNSAPSLFEEIASDDDTGRSGKPPFSAAGR